MVESSNSQRLILPIAPLVASVVGVLTAAIFALVPTDLLESMVVDSGLAAVLSAAEPPLGFTARLVLVLLCGGGVGAVAWFALSLTFGARTIVLQRSRKPVRKHRSCAAPMLIPMRLRVDRSSPIPTSVRRFWKCAPTRCMSMPPRSSGCPN